MRAPISFFLFSERRPTPFWWSRRSHGPKSIWQELDWCQKSTPCLKAVDSTSAFFYPQKGWKKKWNHVIMEWFSVILLMEEIWLTSWSRKFCHTIYNFSICFLWFLPTSHVTGSACFLPPSTAPPPNLRSELLSFAFGHDTNPAGFQLWMARPHFFLNPWRNFPPSNSSFGIQTDLFFFTTVDWWKVKVLHTFQIEVFASDFGK